MHSIDVVHPAPDIRESFGPGTPEAKHLSQLEVDSQGVGDSHFLSVSPYYEFTGQKYSPCETNSDISDISHEVLREGEFRRERCFGALVSEHPHVLG